MRSIYFVGLETDPIDVPKYVLQFLLLHEANALANRSSIASQVHRGGSRERLEGAESWRCQESGCDEI